MHMLEHKKILNFNDFFTDLDRRRSKEVYFYRINGYSEEIGEFIKKYYDAAQRTGVVVEGKILNPDERNLSYYGDIMGMDFQMDRKFIYESLKKWMPGMNEAQRRNVADSMYNSLEFMRKNGKNENILKNVYIKFMCWLYYKFARIVSRLGENNIPKILYEGNISVHELMFISILSNAGCDAVLLQYNGDRDYLKIDPGSVFSDELQTVNPQAFPEGYCIKKIRAEINQNLNNERLYGIKPTVSNCTNAWININGNWLDFIRENAAARGNDPEFFYNAFCRINGAKDKLTYTNELYQLQQELKIAKRNLVIINKEIPKPTPEEISGIKRGNYKDIDQLIYGLTENIRYASNAELQKIMRKAFVDIMLEETKKNGFSPGKLTSKAVYLLCWLKRYAPLLFPAWKMPETGCFIYMGCCRNSNEAALLKFFARLPTDVLVLRPDLNTVCCLEDDLLYDINYQESLQLDRYPDGSSQVKIGTAAYHAERELDTLMYQDSGLYRNQQYSKANVINLQTIYEEIKILWDQEIKYRPNFSTTGGAVNIPVIFAKISGVKDGALPQYWESVKELITDDTIVIKEAPYLKPNTLNPMKVFSAEFYKNGRLQKNIIKKHPKYPYGILREDTQDFILEKLDVLINRKLINGTGKNGIEYTIIAQVLNLPKEIIRQIQKFDFTRKNPKIIYINTSETPISLEDSILTAFLNLIGFDILFFVPTGYQSIEKYFSGNFIEEHNIGEFMYDVTIPDLSGESFKDTCSKWYKKIFKKGN